MTQDPPYPPQGQPYRPPMRPEDERTWAGAAHWSALVGAFVALAFLGPLLVLVAKGNDSPWVRRHAVESLNFQLSMLLYGFVGSIVGVLVAVLTLGIGLLVLVPLGIAIAIAWLVLTIIAAVRVSGGEDYRYPLTIRMVS